MTVPPDDPGAAPPPPPATQRGKWVGRIIILAFGALLLVYFVPLAISQIWPQP